MMQHPRVTVGWTVVNLERAIGNLGDSPAEARVRRQFHQLVLALERDGYLVPDQRILLPPPVTARLVPIGNRPS